MVHLFWEFKEEKGLWQRELKWMKTNLNLFLKNEDSDDQGEKKRNQCQGKSLSEKDPQKNEHRRELFEANYYFEY